ncbi:hypothetical protein HPB47_000529, partial [Ixodes persulcatus]
HRPDRLPVTSSYHSERLACDSSTASRRSMSGEKFPDIRTVVGIQYFSDVSCPTKCQAMVLGAVVLESVTISADELRRIMCDQLPSLPTHFTFVTKERVRLGYCATEAHSSARGGASASAAAMASLLWNAQTAEARAAVAPARQLCSRLCGSEARALVYGSPCGGFESRP